MLCVLCCRMWNGGLKLVERRICTTVQWYPQDTEDIPATAFIYDTVFEGSCGTAFIGRVNEEESAASMLVRDVYEVLSSHQPVIR
ncbi:hypothetical protein C0J52_22705 [Blattella germanica]|nr:hypothetical protein C0J52_22705 [Blattella germanica]